MHVSLSRMGSEVTLVSSARLEPGDQLLLDYGQLPNDELLQRFNFLQRDNAHDRHIVDAHSLLSFFGGLNAKNAFLVSRSTLLIPLPPRPDLPAFRARYPPNTPSQQHQDLESVALLCLGCPASCP